MLVGELVLIAELRARISPLSRGSTKHGLSRAHAPVLHITKRTGAGVGMLSGGQSPRLGPARATSPACPHPWKPGAPRLSRARVSSLGPPDCADVLGQLGGLFLHACLRVHVPDRWHPRRAALHAAHRADGATGVGRHGLLSAGDDVADRPSALLDAEDLLSAPAGRLPGRKAQLATAAVAAQACWPCLSPGALAGPH